MPASKSVESVKKEVVKAEVKPGKKVANATGETKETRVEKSVSKKTGGFSIALYSLLGKEAGQIDLPKEVFGVKVNRALLAQALRVYQNNLKAHHSSTKTRGEVQGSTRKLFKQKGTGRARHGSIMAPIFVGGGIALGPKPRSVNLDLPAKMKAKALISALSQRVLDQKILAVSGLEKATGKTKEVVKLIDGLGEGVKGKSILFIAEKEAENAKRAVKNLPKVSLKSASSINAFDVISNQNLILTKEAVESLEKRLGEKV